MVHANSGGAQSISLRVACLGDPDLNLTGTCTAVVGSGTPPAELQEGAESNHTSVNGPDAASGSYQQRPNGEGEYPMGMQNRSRRHNLRPRIDFDGLYGLAKSEEDADNREDKLGEAEEEVSEGECKRKGKKKVGRPIAYTGDPDSPHLTEAERRRLRRRVANRESARRVRNKRQDAMEELQTQVAAVQTQNQQLTVHITEVERCKTSIVRDIQELQAKSDAAIEHNASLREEVHNMHSQLNDRDRSFGGNQTPFAGGIVMDGVSQPEHLPQPLPASFVPLFTAGSIGVQRQSSVHPPPELDPLPEIEPLTGLEQLGSL